ncbi:type III secretion protein [Leifsonia sp. Leaf325]|nr:EscU/YscU/HrcU family type III secretion system export apparatus switch protein [Leifsonia sp. Leaf325]KQQ95529.1 type III secretion protein [Leifsonia sp. Leaf325]
MAESDSQERTEQATPKRMKEVRRKGQLTTSQDLTAWVGIGAAAVMLPSTIQRGVDAGVDQMFAISSVIADPDPAVAVTAMQDAFGSLGTVLGPMLGVVLIAVIAGAVVQGGVHMRAFTGKFEQFNLVSGVQRVFGLRALYEGVKSLTKTLVVGIVLAVVIVGLVPVLSAAGSLPISRLLGIGEEASATLIRTAVTAGLVLAAIDVLVVMRRNRTKSRMTKREVLDENKNTDGDPLIKSQRRSRQLAMSRNRMIAAVADADVVLVNPTHIAIALSYTPGKSAPRVVAKGSELIATRIREKAEEHRVPLVRDVQLARALHAGCEVGQVIPAEFYTAVARVLAFVMALERRGTRGGMHTILPAAVGATGG